MIERTLVRIYAEALYEMARERDAVDTVRGELEELENLFEQSREFSSFLVSPNVDRKEKKRVVRKALGEALSPLTLHFLLILVDKNREVLIPHIAEEFNGILDRALNRTDVDVTSAVPLEEDIVTQIRESLARTLEKEVTLRMKVDPSILGGIIVRVEDRVLDGSLLGQFERLRARMLGSERRSTVANEDTA
jgi:F-type H+-transporting ATPase subunit delta